MLQQSFRDEGHLNDALQPAMSFKWSEMSVKAFRMISYVVTFRQKQVVLLQVRPTPMKFVFVAFFFFNS